MDIFIGSLLVLLPVLVVSIIYFLRSGMLFKRRLRKEVRETNSALHKAFDLLREDVAEHISFLEEAKNQRELSAEEELVLRQLKRDLDDAERYIKKEIEDIEKEVE